jgi:uncharacterized protein (TIGR03663 family)
MKRELFVILLVAAVTRLLLLDARPVDFDESVHGWIALKSVLESQNYVYNPAYHGPFQYFILATLFKVIGDSDLSLRLPAAMFSILGVLAALSLRRWIGYAAYIFAFFILFSPSILYYSRYARNDLIVLSSFLLVLYFYLKYRDEGKILYALLATIFLAVIFTSKENWIEYIPMFLVFIPVYSYYSQRSFRSLVTKKNLTAIAVGAITFTAIASFLYSSSFVYLLGGGKDTAGQDALKDALNALLSIEWVKHYFNVSLSYWLSNSLPFGGEKAHFHPIWYYLSILLKYEFLALGMAFASLPYLRRRAKSLSFIEALSVFWLITAVLFYHAMAYKTPWLVVHLVAPIAFFGSVFAGRELFDEEKEAFRLAFVFLSFITVLLSIHLSFVDYNDAAGEDIIYVQTQPEGVELAKRIEELVHDGKRVLVYVPENYYWPLPWMLRHENVAFTGEKCLLGLDYVFTSAKEECEKLGYYPVRDYEMRVGFHIWEMR